MTRRAGEAERRAAIARGTADATRLTGRPSLPRPLDELEIEAARAIQSASATPVPARHGRSSGGSTSLYSSSSGDSATVPDARTWYAMINSFLRMNS